MRRKEGILGIAMPSYGHKSYGKEAQGFFVLPCFPMDAGKSYGKLRVFFVIAMLSYGQATLLGKHAVVWFCNV